MFFSSIKTQMKIISKQKSFIISTLIIYAFVILNFADNLRQFYGYDVAELIHPMKMTFLDTYGKWAFYFMEYYPVLLIFPASFSYFLDKSNSTDVYLRSKFGSKNYCYGKIIAVFAMTFIAFALPLFYEFLLNIITFPIEAIGDRSNNSYFSEVYSEQVNGYWLSPLWKVNPYLYYAVFIVMFSSVTASFAAFVAGLSMTNIMKFKIFALLPIYLLLTFLTAIEGKLGFITNYTFHLKAFDGCEKPDMLYPAIALVLLIIAFTAAGNKGREGI